MAKKVLVVDDEPDIARLAEIALANGGFDVATAHTGEEALDKIAQDPPDVVVLDVMMPRMDGFEVAGRLRKDPETAHIRILMLTARGAGEQSLPGSVQVDEYYAKPFEPARLVKLVRELAGPDEESRG